MDTRGGRVVGRSTEWEIAVESWRLASAGGSRLLIVTGEAGAGKTTLLRGLAEQNAPESAVWGNCYAQATGAPPLAPFLNIVRQLLRRSASAEAVGATALHLALAELVPGALAAPTGPLSLATATAHPFDALLHVIQLASATTAQMVLVEDLQWATPTTWEFLEYLVRSLSTEPVLVVVSVRSGDLPDDPRAGRALAELQRLPNAQLVPLLGLDVDAVQELLIAIRREPVDHREAESIHGFTGGLPFYVESVANSSDHRELPAPIGDIVLGRLGSADEQVRAALVMIALASVSGPVPSECVCDVTLMSAPAFDRLLRRLIRRRIVETTEEGGIVFRHELERVAVEDQCVPSERRRLHEEIALSLEAREVGVSARLATHWRAASRDDRALPHSRDAGIEARRGGGFYEAIEHLQFAWNTLLAAPGDDAPSNQHDPLDVGFLLAETAFLAGDTPLALSVIRHAQDISASRGREEDGKILSLQSRIERSHGSLSNALGLLEGATTPEREPRPTDSGVAFDAELAVELALSMRLDEAEPVARRALSDARAIGSEFALGRSLGALGMLQIKRGRVSGVGTLEQSLATVKRCGDADGVVRGYANLSDAYRMSFQYRRALDCATEGVRLLSGGRSRSPMSRFITANQVDCLVVLGRAREAVDVHAMSHADEDSAATPEHHLTLGWVWAMVRLGRIREIEDEGGLALLERSPQLADLQFSAATDRTRAEYLWLTGDLESAVAAVDAALDREDGLGSRAWYPELCALGTRLLVDLANRGDAVPPGKSRGGVERFSERLADVTGELTICSMPPALATALCVAESFRYGPHRSDSGARGAWEGAVAVAQSYDDEYHMAYASCRLAEFAVGRDEGDRYRYAERVESAARWADQVGAEHLRNRISLIRRRTRLKPETTTNEDAGERTAHAAATGWSLTTRESEVLSRVSSGMSNRKIADELFISPKTVSVHVTNILRKLQVPDRSSIERKGGA